MDRWIGFAVRYVYALVASLYVFLGGFLVPRNRLLLFAICSHFGYRQRSRIPQVDVATVLDRSAPVDLREAVAVEGNVTLLELLIIDQLIRLRRPKALFEIGTFDGRTTLNMAANCPEDGQVYTLDLPADSSHTTAFPLDTGDQRFIKKTSSGARYVGTPFAPRIHQLYGDSASFNFEPYRSAIDLLFVDGAHSYDYVLNDSRRAHELLRDGRGLILWHDYLTWEGVTKALNELYLTNEAFRGLRHVRGTSLVYLERT
jgi:hypothetical protein